MQPLAELSVSQALEVQEDLLEAFAATDFQLRLLTLRQAHFSDMSSLGVAMRDTAMVAQKRVLQKYNFPESPEGLAALVQSLSCHFRKAEGMCQSGAAGKAKALSIGFAAGQLQGWTWPQPDAAADDGSSTAYPGSGGESDAFSEADEEVAQELLPL